MCCGSELDMDKLKELQDPNVIKARGVMLNTALANLGKNATPFPANTPVAAGTNALRRNSSNLLNAMMTGKPYSAQKPGTYGNFVDPSAVGKYEVGGSGEHNYICPVCNYSTTILSDMTKHYEETGHGPKAKPYDYNDPGDIIVRGGGSGSSKYFDPYSSESWMGGK